jgi:hypothetical protein
MRRANANGTKKQNVERQTGNGRRTAWVGAPGPGALKKHKTQQTNETMQTANTANLREKDKTSNAVGQKNGRQKDRNANKIQPRITRITARPQMNAREKKNRDKNAFIYHPLRWSSPGTRSKQSTARQSIGYPSGRSKKNKPLSRTLSRTKIQKTVEHKTKARSRIEWRGLQNITFRAES